jgi:hypothetical protein
MHKVLTVVVIVVIIILVLVVVAAARDDRRGSRSVRRSILDRSGESRPVLRGSHPEGCCSDPNCCAGGDRPHAPRDLCCSSEERYSLDVKWKPSASACDHYRLYVKFLNECDAEQSNSSDSSSSTQRYSAATPMVAGRRHGHGCRCNICVSVSLSSSSSSSESRAPRCECGPENFDRIIEIPAHERYIRIEDIKKKAVCVAMTAVSRCGRESYTSNCCQTWIKGKCKVEPCIVKNTCSKLNLRWEPVDCAKKIRIYYDDELMFELEGDRQGVKNLPPITGESAPTVTVATVNMAGVEGKRVQISETCGCKGDRCGRCKECNEEHSRCRCRKERRTCFKCSSPEESCRCKGKRTSPRTPSSSSSSSSDHRRRR